MLKAEKHDVFDRGTNVVLHGLWLTAGMRREMTLFGTSRLALRCATCAASSVTRGDTSTLTRSVPSTARTSPPSRPNVSTSRRQVAPLASSSGLAAFV